MRVYEMTASFKTINRSAGRSSVGAAAYRSASRIVDERTGIVHDYTKKQGVEFSRIYLPENAPEEYQDRAILWNAVEVKENRNNSQTARELMVGFPSEFNAMQRREAGDKIVQELMGRYGCAIDICYHAPSKNGDERNYHAHILFTGRGFDETRPDGWAKNKYRDLNKDALLDEHGKKQRGEDGKIITRSSHEVSDLRQFAALTMNEIASRDGLEVHTEHLSFEARGVGKEPSIHLGPNAAAMENRGINTERGNKNRDIRAANDNITGLQEESKIIDLEFERRKREILEEIKQERLKDERKEESASEEGRQGKAELSERQKYTVERVEDHKGLAFNPMSNLQGWIDTRNRIEQGNINQNNLFADWQESAEEYKLLQPLDTSRNGRGNLEKYEQSYFEHVRYLKKIHQIAELETRVNEAEEHYQSVSGFWSKMLRKKRYEHAYGDLENAKIELSRARNELQNDLNRVHERPEYKRYIAELEAQEGKAGEIQGKADQSRERIEARQANDERENQALREAENSPESAERLAPVIHAKSTDQKNRLASVKRKTAERQNKRLDKGVEGKAARTEEEASQTQEIKRQNDAKRLAKMQEKQANDNTPENGNTLQSDFDKSLKTESELAYERKLSDEALKDEINKGLDEDGNRIEIDKDRGIDI